MCGLKCLILLVVPACAECGAAPPPPLLPPPSLVVMALFAMAGYAVVERDESIRVAGILVDGTPSDLRDLRGGVHDSIEFSVRGNVPRLHLWNTFLLKARITNLSNGESSLARTTDIANRSLLGQEAYAMCRLSFCQRTFTQCTWCRSWLQVLWFVLVEPNVCDEG